MAFRTFVYNVLFYLLTFVMMVVGMPVMLFGRRFEMRWVRLWSHVTMALHRAVTGIRHEIRGWTICRPVARSWR